MSANAEPHCGACRRFRNDAAFIEQQTPGLQTLSSGFGAVRGNDGLCAVHQRYLPASSYCAQFAPRGAGTGSGTGRS